MTDALPVSVSSSDSLSVTLGPGSTEPGAFMPAEVQFTDVMGVAVIALALVAACLANTRWIPRISEEEQELLAGGSLLLAILGTIFVASE